jgi:hypothetical protein
VPLRCCSPSPSWLCAGWAGLAHYRTSPTTLDTVMSVKKFSHTVPFKVGPDPRRGRGPAKGAPNAGRPPDEWRAALRALASRDDVLQHLDAVLRAGPGHPWFSKALDYATEHGYGKAKQAHEIGSANVWPSVSWPTSVKVVLVDPPPQAERLGS